MTTPQHSPSPWVARQDNPQCPGLTHIYSESMQEKGMAIATLFGKETLTDGRVIAAAPDMLAALEELVEIAEQRGYQPDWLINAHAAIAKARGQV